jgi:hypothetical protein
MCDLAVTFHAKALAQSVQGASIARNRNILADGTLAIASNRTALVLGVVKRGG